METISAILIDDELNAIRALQYELKAFEDTVEVTAQFNDVYEAQQFLNNNPVDLVFLDIEMPGLNGLDFLNQFPNRDFFVVFTTAHSNYALNAFKLDALDYLLKPIDGEDLQRAIQKVEKAVRNELMESRLMAAVDKLNEMDGTPKKVKLAYDGKVVFYDPNEIIHCEAEGNYCHIYLEKNEKLLLTLKLKDLEELLPVHYFYRIHNSFIINLSKVKAFHKGEGSVEMSNKAMIPVSRHKRMEILNKI